MKDTENGTGTFNFILQGLSSSTANVTVFSETTAKSAGIFTGSIGTKAVITEADHPYYTTSIICTDSNKRATGNADIVINNSKTVTIPSTAMKDGARFICTYTNVLAINPTNPVSGINLDCAAGESLYVLDTDAPSGGTTRKLTWTAGSKGPEKYVFSNSGLEITLSFTEGNYYATGAPVISNLST
ncbi:prealbumin-like fold domain-containing protein [Deinococcus piscis]|nr:hypothetical protein [Deinococcus piscis]